MITSVWLVIFLSRVTLGQKEKSIVKSKFKRLGLKKNKKGQNTKNKNKLFLRCLK